MGAAEGGEAGSGAGELGASGGRGISLGALGCVAMMVLIGSSTAPAAKIAVRELPVGLVPLVRFGVAGLVLGPIFLRGGRWLRLIREDWRLLLVASACCVPINQFLFLGGARLAPAGHIGMIYAAAPLVVLALAVLAGQERLGARKVVGVLASVLGVGLIALENVLRGGAAGGSVLRGDLLEVGAVLAWGSYLAANKPLVARHGALPTLAATFLVGVVLDVPVALWSLPDWRPLAEVSAPAWVALFYLATVVTIGALAFQNLAMRRLDASQVATFGNVAPLLTVLWGTLLFGERVTPVSAVGGMLVLAGIAATLARGKARSPLPSAAPVAVPPPALPRAVALPAA